MVCRMKKIPTMFVRDEKDRSKITPQLHPECIWVGNGAGFATEKIDGTCCMVRGDVLFKRYTIRGGANAPDGFEATGEVDLDTGKQPGWAPVTADPNDIYHVEAWGALNCHAPDGTYELVGPKIQKNPHAFDSHQLVPHGDRIVLDVPRNYQGLKEYLADIPIEGIVFYHPDGRMAKIKRRDFGLPWPADED
jgi:hypothetical protein